MGVKSERKRLLRLLAFKSYEDRLGNPLLLMKCRNLTGVLVRTYDNSKKKQQRHDGGRDGRDNDSEITAGRWLRLLP